MKKAVKKQSFARRVHNYITHAGMIHKHSIHDHGPYYLDSLQRARGLAKFLKDAGFLYKNKIVAREVLAIKKALVAILPHEKNPSFDSSFDQLEGIIAEAREYLQPTDTKNIIVSNSQTSQHEIRRTI
jgi:hypothetical protein